MPIKALIFDFDGTLADTMPLHWRAWSMISKKHGIILDETRLYSFGGVPSRDIVKILNREQGLTLDPLMIAKEKEELYLSMMPEATPIDCVLSVALENYKKRPMAVASGGSRKSIGTTLNHLGLAYLFDAVVTNEDVVRQKPAPDIYLEAARRLGVAAQFCRGYEDTDLGLEGLRAAGMEAVDVRVLRKIPKGALKPVSERISNKPPHRSGDGLVHRTALGA